MRKLAHIFTNVENRYIKEILDLFNPLLKLLALDNEFYLLKKDEFSTLIQKKKPFQYHPFHLWFKRLLKNAVILDSLQVYDCVRYLFLNHFAIASPDCLECPDKYGCCHRTYTIEIIDYERIIAKKLINHTLLSHTRNRTKLRLHKDRNGQKYCSAFDLSTKKCLIHPFKPPTCSKYPLISNIHNWSNDLMAWTGKCAHSKELWVTRVHPAVMNSCRDLMMHAQLLWESERALLNHIATPLDCKMKEILSRTLALKQLKMPYKDLIIKKILLEDYSESTVLRAIQLTKKY